MLIFKNFKTLDALFKIYNRKWIIFGSGQIARNVVTALQVYPEFDSKIAYIVDNDDSKWHTKFYDKLILPPSKLLQESKDETAILICSSYYNEILTQLTENGFIEDDNCFDAAKYCFDYNPYHFYMPIPDLQLLEKSSIWARKKKLHGLNWNEQQQIAFLETIYRNYYEEYSSLPIKPTDNPYEFFLDNGNFCSVDAEILYSMIRHFKPNKMIEIGSGYSTLLSSLALKKNFDEIGKGCIFTAIEPYPRAMLANHIPELTELIQMPVQQVPVSKFDDLNINDILFIDSSHVLKLGSDVEYEFMEILPRIKPGVIVHFHDIFLPMEYPKQWVLEEERYWNEQHLLFAFLTYNKNFEILWAGNYMNIEHPDLLKKVFKSYSPGIVLPGSFWIRRVE